MTNSDQGNAEGLIVQVATAIVSGTIDLVSGSRKLCALRHKTDAAYEELFNPIVAFESETDRFPVGHDRVHYNPSYLQQLDQELKEHIEHDGPAVVAACKRIIDSLT